LSEINFPETENDWSSYGKYRLLDRFELCMRNRIRPVSVLGQRDVIAIW